MLSEHAAAATVVWLIGSLVVAGMHGIAWVTCLQSKQ